MKFFAPVSALALSLFVAVTAHAEVPAGVTTSITTASADGLTILGQMAAGGAALYIIWKVLGKMGIRL